MGANPAAARLDGYLRPGIATLYAEMLPSHLRANHRLRRDPEGDVAIRKQFWAHELRGGKPDLVLTLLIYADLLATGEARCIDAAERVITPISMNFSDRDELIYLADLTAAGRDAAPDVPFYLAGALAPCSLYSEVTHLLDAMEFDYKFAGE